MIHHIADKVVTAGAECRTSDLLKSGPCVHAQILSLLPALLGFCVPALLCLCGQVQKLGRDHGIKVACPWLHLEVACFWVFAEAFP